MKHQALTHCNGKSTPCHVIASVDQNVALQVGTNSLMQPTHRNNLKYCCIEALDSEGEDLLLKLQQAKALQFLDSCLAQNGGVLIHCFVSLRPGF